jgi:molybdopterin/thiamine biosynthesis adenylyltransferase
MNTGESGQVVVSSCDLEGDRFSRFRLITWWNQERLHETNVVVIGAGALGNEILKNLALLGFRRIVVVDLDRIEYSNLSRSVLFRSGDVGRSKAERAAAATLELAHDASVHPINANVTSEVGLGLFGWADVIIAGLDNREARLWINRCAWKMNRPWVDGAIEGISGVARVFLPGQAPCYECTLGETDWAILEKRLSCNLLTRDEMLGGKTPTTPTTSSVIAGIQVQEAVKLIHGLPVLAGKGFVFEGLHHSSYVTEYTENPDCMSHETFSTLIEFPGTSESTTLVDLYGFAVKQFGVEQLVIEFSRDVIHKLVCPHCHASEELFAAVGTVSHARGICPVDGIMREVVTVHNYSGQEPFGLRTLSELGLPPFDVFVARHELGEAAILMSGDRSSVLGPLAKFKSTVWPRLQDQSNLEQASTLGEQAEEATCA